MVRKQQKDKKPGIEALQKLEEETDLQIDKIHNIRDKTFRDQEMDLGFYFCVCFDSRLERDAWLKDRKLVLEEDFYIRASNFKV